LRLPGFLKHWIRGAGSLYRTEYDRHRTVDDALAFDARDSLQKSHPAAQTQDHRFDLHNVARMNGAAVADALDTRKQRQPLPVLGLGENEDCADLCDGLGENGRRQNLRAVRFVREVPFVERDVLDADDSLVDLELRDAIDEEKRIAMRENPLDGGVVERQRQVHRGLRLYWDCRVDSDSRSCCSHQP
jgi:hypothetical protein